METYKKKWTQKQVFTMISLGLVIPVQDQYSTQPPEAVNSLHYSLPKYHLKDLR